MTSRCTDIELIYQVLHENNSRAFEILMNRYTAAVYGAAMRLMKDEENAAEVTQLAFIQAYKQLDSWRGDHFGSWVTIIANHIALRLLEREKRNITAPLDENVDLPDEDYDEQKEQRLQLLEQAVSQLPEQDRFIIEQHYYKSVALAEIARQLNQTENNVKVRLFRIREKLKKNLQSQI